MTRAPQVDSQKWRPAAEAYEWNPERFDFRWNEDFTEFRLVPLLWWDDASYLAYECDSGGVDTSDVSG